MQEDFLEQTAERIQIQRVQERGNREGYRKRVFLICFFFGVVLGTIIGNLGFLEQSKFAGGFSYERENDIADAPFIFGTPVQNSSWRLQSGSLEKFLYIGKQRMEEGMAIWLFSLTICAVPLFWILAVYLGFSLGWVVVCYTVQLGIMGLAGFFLSCFPQWLFYLPAWYLFIWQGLNRPARLRMIPSLLAIGFFCLGAGAEAYWNPVFLRLI
jgi:hypothetical protein